MGEAALAGVPIVCTDVGASFRVVTDAQGTEPFSAIVGPNDVYALARAQINLLALLDGFGQDNGDPGDVKPTMPYEPTSADVERVTQRMYQGKTERRRLGFLGRKNVLESFSGDRYLREHEQMLWIGKHSSASYSEKRATPARPRLIRIFPICFRLDATTAGCRQRKRILRTARWRNIKGGRDEEGSCL
jgi:hypothetical protein